MTLHDWTLVIAIMLEYIYGETHMTLHGRTSVIAICWNIYGERERESRILNIYGERERE